MLLSYEVTISTDQVAMAAQIEKLMATKTTKEVADVFDLAGCEKTLPIGRFAGETAGETACATKKNQALAKHGGVGIQPARTFFGILLDNKSMREFFAGLFSDSATWLACAGALGSWVSGHLEWTTAAAIAALSKFGTEAFKAAPARNERLRQNDFALLYFLRR